MVRRIQLPLIPTLWGFDQAEARERQDDNWINGSNSDRSQTTAGLDTDQQEDDLLRQQGVKPRLASNSTDHISSDLLSAPSSQPPALAQQPQPLEQPEGNHEAGHEQATAQENRNGLQGELVQDQVTTWQMTENQPEQALATSSDGGTQKDPPGIICHELASEALLSLDSTQTVVSATPLLDPGFTFLLHSRPSASKIIYLDFDGHTTSGTAWNDATMGSSFYSPAYDIDGNPSSFSDAELTRIQQIWQRVAADFTPFNVDVTTQAPLDNSEDWLARSSSTDAYYGVRAVITSYGPYSSSAGGVSIVGSFTSSADTPVYIYNTSNIGVSEAISHEVGHSLGLSHDGTSSAVYYQGHGTGETSWGPIMGANYNRNVTTWDDGTYTGSNNTGSTANYGSGANDISVIVNNNGFGCQPDLVGNDRFNAAPLTISTGTVGQFGTIETRSDTDWFSFNLLDVGDVSLTFDPYWYRAYVDADGVWGGSSSTYLAQCSDINSVTPYSENASNLDLAVDLYDSKGTLLYRADSPGLATSLYLQGLAASTYYLKLDGVGYGDPTASTPTGYTDVASLGNYWISGTITHAADNAGGGSSPLPILSISGLSKAEGTGSSLTTFQLNVTLDRASSSDITLNYHTIDGTATSSGTGADYQASSGTLRIAAGATSATIAIGVTADATPEADESFQVAFDNPVGATLMNTQVQVVILNDDTTTTSGGKGSKRQNAKGLSDGGSTLARQESSLLGTPEAIDPLTGMGEMGSSSGEPIGFTAADPTPVFSPTDDWGIGTGLGINPDTIPAPFLSTQPGPCEQHSSHLPISHGSDPVGLLTQPPAWLVVG